jgi:hypothetical protein
MKKIYFNKGKMKVRKMVRCDNYFKNQIKPNIYENGKEH